MRQLLSLSIVPALLAFGSVPAAAGSLGANGHRVDPLIVTWTLNNPGGGFWWFDGVPTAELMSLCADDDGCEVRLTSVGASDRSIGVVTGFVIDSVNESWQATYGEQVLSGQNGDGDFHPVSANDRCVLGDDGILALGLSTDWIVGCWGLVGKIVLRVDD